MVEYILEYGYRLTASSQGELFHEYMFFFERKWVCVNAIAFCIVLLLRCPWWFVISSELTTCRLRWNKETKKNSRLCLFMDRYKLFTGWSQFYCEMNLLVVHALSLWDCLLLKLKASLLQKFHRPCQLRYRILTGPLCIWACPGLDHCDLNVIRNWCILVRLMCLKNVF